MSTEILGFFIIMGALVLVVLRRNDWLKLLTGETQHSHFDDAEEASAKLRYELQHSADQIISRMGLHIERLEHLVAEADQRSHELEGKLIQLEESYQRLLKRTEAEPVRRAAAQSGLIEHNRQDAYVQHPVSGVELRHMPLTQAAPQGIPGEHGEHQPFADMLEESMTFTDSTDGYEQRARATHPGYEMDPEVFVSPSVADVVGLPLTPEEAADVEAATVIEPAEEMQPMPEADFAAEPRQQIPQRVVQQMQPTQMMPQQPMMQSSQMDAQTRQPMMQSQQMEAQPQQVFAPVAAAQPTAGQYAPVEEEHKTDTSYDLAASLKNSAMETADTVQEADEAEAQEPQEAEEKQDNAEQEEKDRQAVEEAIQLHGGGASERARELLAEGKSVEEVAREVHLGRGAVELIKQMEMSRDSTKNA